MGRNIFLLVVLLCWWPAVYITVFGYRGGCPKNQKHVPCRPDDTSPEQTCPGVGVSCVHGEQVCGCVHNLYRNNKFKCVNYADCVERTFYTLEFLKQQQIIYLVGDLQPRAAESTALFCSAA
ncbi:hypothetical protein MTO96_036038 [Rhipicephalus appendiculatus]